MSRILIIEDEEKISRFVELELSHEGYETGKAADGRSGLDEALRGDYDLVILDIMLPVIDGFEVLRRTRNRGIAIPIILLTARSALRDKVGGMDLGADDYLTKPFAMQELLARIRMVSRRSAGTTTDNRIRAGELRLDPGTYELSREGEQRTVRLGAKEYQLMEYLMRNA